jgi:hypothetical protein
MGVFIGRGIVYAAPVDATTGHITGGYVDLGEVENFAPGADIQTIEKRTSRNSSNGLVARIETQINSKLTLVLNEPNTDNLVYILRGDQYTQAASPITDENLRATGLVAGDYLYTKHPIGTWTSLKDSAGSPATLVENTDYEIVDADYGQIKLLNVSGDTQPYKANYTPQAYTGVRALMTDPLYYRIRIDGINLVDSTKFIAEYYKVRLSPATEFPLIGQDFAQYTLEGAALADSTKTSDSVLGSYGRFIQGL